MKKIILMAFILILVAAPTAAAALTRYYCDVLIIIDEPTVTLACDPNDPAENVTLYRFRIVCIETKQEWTAESPIPAATFTRPRTGHFIGSAQACDASGQCSTWTVSTDTGPAVPERFLLFWRMTTPAYTIK